jgi:hypothetical protein
MRSVSCLGVGVVDLRVKSCVVSLRCLVSKLFRVTNRLLDRNENGLARYGFEKSSFRLGFGLHTPEERGVGGRG